jgi:mRNA interferase MazF
MRRGEIYTLPALRDRHGHEQKGRRYAVIVQGNAVANTSTVLFAPTSTRAIPTLHRPEIELAGRRTRVLTEQMTAVDRARLGRHVGELSAGEQRAVDAALKLVLGLL